MRRFAAMPIDEKLKLVVFVTSALTLIVAYTCLFLYDMRAHRHSLEKSLNTLARVMAANSAAAVIAGDHTAATELLSALQVEPDVLGACVYGSDGEQFARYFKVEEEVEFPLTAPDSGFTYLGDRIMLSRSIRTEKAAGSGSPVGKVYLVADSRGSRERLTMSAGIAALVMLASLLLVYLLSGPLRRFISAPIVALAETTRAVSKDRNYALRAEK